jgi:hypothetical protein
MIGHWNQTESDSQRRFRGTTACSAVLAWSLLMAAGAVAQEAVPPPPPQTRPQPQTDPHQFPAFQPGFLDALGRWLGDSKSKLDDQFKDTTDAARGAAAAAGQATGAILGIPGTRVVIGRERCAVAANGAPDCAPAADALCRAKGFDVGKGVDINTAQKCPTWVWLSGRPPPDGVCVTETFVLRAMCR